MGMMVEIYVCNHEVSSYTNSSQNNKHENLWDWKAKYMDDKNTDGISLFDWAAYRRLSQWSRWNALLPLMGEQCDCRFSVARSAYCSHHLDEKSDGYGWVA